jgi:RNA polymerase sigma-70 factor (sigma-E family)
VTVDEESRFRAWAVGVRPRLRRTAFLLSGDWHLAEDLAQDALVRVYAVWVRVSQTGSPDAYAMRTLVNCHRAAVRRPWRREHVTDSVPDVRATQGTSGADDDRDVLVAALGRLGRSQRTIVVLRYWDDISVEDVAATLGLSPGTVKSQSARGLARLRALLDDLDAGPGHARPILPPLVSLETGDRS